MMRKTIFVAVMVVLASTGVVFAQCNDPNNLLTSDQCGFDTPASVGLPNWEAVPYSGIPFDPTWGSVEHQTTGGYMTPGVMMGTPEDNGAPPFGWGWTNAARICLNYTVTPGQEFGFGGYIKVTNGTLEWCNVMATTMATSACDGGIDFANYQSFVVPADTWFKLNETDATLTITQAADYLELRVACAGPDSYTLWFDNMYIGETLVPVELQSITVE